MCLVLYLGSDKSRALVAWDENAPRFHVKDDDDDAKKASIHFGKRLTYYIGSDDGCGCGFRQESDYMIDDNDQIASKADNQKRLHDYITDCLVDEETVELYSCWSGDEELPQEHERTIDVAELIDNEFFFAERQRTIVMREAL